MRNKKNINFLTKKAYDVQQMKRTLTQFADNACPDQPAQADLGLHCLPTELVDTEVYIVKQNVQSRP